METNYLCGFLDSFIKISAIIFAFMKVNGKHYRTIWMEGHQVKMIHQNKLPFNFEIFESENYKETCHAIKTMIVRGAGAIGAAAGFAMAQACLEAKRLSDYVEYIRKARTAIEATRPTAQNLFYAVNAVFDAGLHSAEKAVERAQELADENAREMKLIGEEGNKLIPQKMNIATHCNAGWLAFVDYGSALAPVYEACRYGKEVLVYVDETRPRNQGARLTAWELEQEHIPHAVIADNANAWLMSQGKIDMMITGADRIAANGDVANKIGTLEKAIVAKAFGVPFYVAAPLSTFDFECASGKEILIEHRNPEEVLWMEGPDKNSHFHRIRTGNPGSQALNPAFDVTPAHYISGIITKTGVIKPHPAAIMQLKEFL